jgi:hypothetical protein
MKRCLQLGSSDRKWIGFENKMAINYRDIRRSIAAKLYAALTQRGLIKSHPFLVTYMYIIDGAHKHILLVYAGTNV